MPHPWGIKFDAKTKTTHSGVKFSKKKIHSFSFMFAYTTSEGVLVGLINGGAYIRGGGVFNGEKNV